MTLLLQAWSHQLLHAFGHELKIVMPAVGACAALVGSPFVISLFFLFTRSSRITLVNHGRLCRSCFLGRRRCWRGVLLPDSLIGMSRCVFLGTFAPELWPRLP